MCRGGAMPALQELAPQGARGTDSLVGPPTPPTGCGGGVCHPGSRDGVQALWRAFSAYQTSPGEVKAYGSVGVSAMTSPPAVSHSPISLHSALSHFSRLPLWHTYQCKIGRAHV